MASPTDDEAAPNLFASHHSELSAMKTIYPKTKISHAILHENTSQQRHLTMALQRLNHHQERSIQTFTLSIKNFTDKQKQKHSKWKREDEVRSFGMNFPVVASAPNTTRVDSAQTIYRSPTYLDDGPEKTLSRESTLLPYMSVSRDQLKYVQHRQNTFLTRLPTIINIDEQKFDAYKKFCRTDLNQSGEPVKDKRFKKLAKVLIPVTCGSLRRTVDHLAAEEAPESSSRSTSEASEDDDATTARSPLFKHNNRRIIKTNTYKLKQEAMKKIQQQQRRESMSLQSNPLLVVECESPNPLRCRPMVAGRSSSSRRSRSSDASGTGSRKTSLFLNPAGANHMLGDRRRSSLLSPDSIPVVY